MIMIGYFEVKMGGIYRGKEGSSLFSEGTCINTNANAHVIAFVTLPNLLLLLGGRYFRWGGWGGGGRSFQDSTVVAA